MTTSSAPLLEQVRELKYQHPARVAYLVGKPSPGVHEPLAAVEVIKGFGFSGDHERKSWWKGEIIPGREVTAMAFEVIRAMRLDPAVPGDNLITRGIDLSQLEAGDVIRIGTVELVRGPKPHRPCALFRQRAGNDAFDVAAAGFRGALFTVAQGGRIAIDDTIEVLGA